MLRFLQRFIALKNTRHARLMVRMDEVLVLIDQTAEEFRWQSDRFFAEERESPVVEATD